MTTTPHPVNNWTVKIERSPANPHFSIEGEVPMGYQTQTPVLEIVNPDPLSPVLNLRVKFVGPVVNQGAPGIGKVMLKQSGIWRFNAVNLVDERDQPQCAAKPAPPEVPAAPVAQDIPVSPPPQDVPVFRPALEIKPVPDDSQGATFIPAN
ncbi:MULTISPECIES: hypothetical protein [Pseudomonas]|uniref:Uncharacterized protein n=1 Tax=Pseudomonas reactans TaxID=117680 RepID=A0A7Y8KG92_9PSED|nr:hypothetical protein [Pseudomonas reactans]NWE88331.1 hypothetical protein [Pseudomonas reactans]